MVGGMCNLFFFKQQLQGEYLDWDCRGRFKVPPAIPAMVPIHGRI